MTTGPPRLRRAGLIAGTLLVALVAILVSTFPKPENDLFFELRTGNDILRTHHVPRVDSYSWVSRGVEWDVPEWFAFVLYSLAFRLAGFNGTFLLMAGVSAASALVLWFVLLKRLTPLWAFQLVNLTLLAVTYFIQERPYVFTYMLLPVALAVVMRARRSSDGAGSRSYKLLWPLVPLCIVWANLHQGVVVFIGMVALFGISDVVSRNSDRSWIYIGTSAVLVLATLISPYSWRLYRNFFVTIRDTSQMSTVTEWRPITDVPAGQLEAFGLLAAITIGAFVLSSVTGRNQDGIVIGAVLIESLLHARNIPIFAITALVVGRDHFASASMAVRRRLQLTDGTSINPLIPAVLAVIYVVLLSLAAYVGLLRAGGRDGATIGAVGATVACAASYPSSACDFVTANGFPPSLRLLNNFEIGGYLIWRLPSEPVFTDGRLDLYGARPYNDMIILARGARTAAWWVAVRRYHFDCVVTTVPAEARAFEALPDWKLVYLDARRPHHRRCRILLRSTMQLQPIIRRCTQGRPPLSDRP